MVPGGLWRRKTDRTAWKSNSRPAERDGCVLDG
jgi:hypothetical protein